MSSRPNSAIKIVPPSPNSKSTSPGTGRLRKDSQRPCRNVMIHGSCKYEGKGCIYQHPPRAVSAPPEDKLSKSAINVNAPAFVPKLTVEPVNESDTDGYFSGPERVDSPSSMFGKFSLGSEFVPKGNITFASVNDTPLQENGYSDYAMSEGGYQEAIAQYDSGDMYYSLGPATPQTFMRQPLNYNLYMPPQTFDANHPATKHFISPTLYEELTARTEALYHVRQAPYYDPSKPDVPGYSNLLPMESGFRVSNWNMSFWRGVKKETGEILLLRRLANFRLPHENAFQTIPSWRRVRSPNLVCLREAFTTRAWGDSSLVLVYDYHPNARSLAFQQSQAPSPLAQANVRRFGNNMSHGGLEERTIWSYLIQLASAIKTVHDAGLAVRTLGATDGSDVWITGKNRIRVGGVGMWDVLGYDPVRQTGSPLEITYNQHEDFLNLGKLLISITGAMGPGAQNQQFQPHMFPKAVEILNRHYSQELKNVIAWLFAKPSAAKSAGSLLDSISNKLVPELDSSHLQADSLENMLHSELENGRLFRLMCKLGFINERPEFDHDPRWSETGDRYIIKLFRDYVFHSVDEDGKPLLSLSHILTCLNKLDVGSEERIMLVSRDEQSCLVVTYAQVKQCVEGAVQDLSRTR